jgi:hypothetical protein
MTTMKGNYFERFKILSIALVLYSISGCKKPESNYILNKYEYSAGDMLLVENLSINSKETKWEVISPENEIIQTSELKNPSLILGIMNPDGYYTLKLTSYSRKEKRSSVQEKPFMIKSLRTYLTINTNGSGDYTDYLVYIDNQLIGKSNYNGLFQKQIPLGYRIVKLVAGNVEKIESIVFKENEWVYINF